MQSFTGYSAQALYPLRKRVPIRQPLGLPWKQERNAAASRPRGQDQPKEKSRPIATVHQRRHQLADLEIAQLPPSTDATSWSTSTTTDPITIYEYWNRKGQRNNQFPVQTKERVKKESSNCHRPPATPPTGRPRVRPIATVHRRYQLADLDHHRSNYILRVLESERPTVQPTFTHRPTFFDQTRLQSQFYERLVCRRSRV